MSRNYTMLTIKTLFGQAADCAYPGCQASLIFADKGVTTVVAQIAHIRSEKSTGPRHDPFYAGDVNGPENLLLLCGTHHPPVDRHESLYPIEELERWKLLQTSAARGGTAISVDQANWFLGTTQEERDAMTGVARRASRVQSLCRAVCDRLNEVESEYRRALKMMRMQFGPAYELNDDGTPVLDADGRKVNANETLRMSSIDEARWEERRQSVMIEETPPAESALYELEEEVSVLRMMNPTLGEAANLVLVAAQGMTQLVRSEAVMEAQSLNVNRAVRDMWLIANPDG